MKYVAIEGSSYVGKTTVVDRFAREGFSVIPEYDSFGPFLAGGDTYSTLKIAALDVINRERQRTAILGRRASSGIVVSDRSPFSLVTFEDMMMHVATTKEERQLRQDMQDFIIETLDESVQAGDIVFPDATVILELGAKDKFDSRVKQRGITPVKHLALFSVQQLIASRTLLYSTLVLGAESSSLIDVSVNSKDEAFLQVNDIVGKVSSSKTHNNINVMKRL